MLPTSDYFAIQANAAKPATRKAHVIAACKAREHIKPVIANKHPTGLTFCLCAISRLALQALPVKEKHLHYTIAHFPHSQNSSHSLVYKRCIEAWVLFELLDHKLAHAAVVVWVAIQLV